MSFDHARYDWLCSQRLWHARRERWKRADHRWHRSQRRYYSQQICTMSGVFTEIVATTVRAYSAELARSVTQNNPLLKRLQENQRAKHIA